MKTTLPFSEAGSGSLVLLFLHFFGSSQREWRHVVERLAVSHHCATADMPGFGDAADVGGYSVSEMTAHVRTLIKHFAPKPVVLVAHSFSGKVGMVLAADPPANFQQLILVAPSPLVPEPIAPEARKEMRERNQIRAGAEAFIAGSHHRKLTESDERIAVEDVLRANQEAWLAWPDRGSLEDWSERVTDLRVRTDLIVGELDRAIPLEFQRTYTLPLVQRSGGRLIVIEDAAHMLPNEAAAELMLAIQSMLKA